MPSDKLRALPTESVHQLAHLLQTLPHERGIQYGERVTNTIARLPSELKHRSRLSNLLSMNVPSPAVESKLCLLHKPLSTSLIHNIFTLLSLEVGHHCNSMTQHNTWLSTHQNTAIQQLRELHSLWLPEQTYRQTFLASPNPRWSHQKSGCEGCILTRIGSDLQIIASLRALLLSRRHAVKKRKSPPALLKLVDGWVVGLCGEGERTREIMQGSEMEGEELKIVRKRIWSEKRDKKRRTKGKGVEAESVEGIEGAKENGMGEDELGQEAYDSDYEQEIIDHYAALRSTLCVPAVQPSPAQTPSLTTDNSANTLSSHLDIETIPSDYMTRPQASSVYSIHQSCQPSSYEPPRRGKAWQGQPTASKQANEYRDLLSSPAAEPLLQRSKSIKEDKSRQAEDHRSPLKVRPEVTLPRSKSVREDKSRPVKEYRIPLEATPKPPLPIPKWVKNESSQWETRDYHTAMTPPPIPEEPVPAHKPAKKGEGKRQTTWSQFCE